MPQSLGGKAARGSDPGWQSLESPPRGSGCRAPHIQVTRAQLFGTLVGGVGLTTGSTPTTPLVPPTPTPGSLTPALTALG